MRQLVAHNDAKLIAISIAAVFFGALTYIGNGPNFMVKTICEHGKVRTPGFIGYILYSIPMLLPLFLLIALLFFSRWRLF